MLSLTLVLMTALPDPRLDAAYRALLAARGDLPKKTDLQLSQTALPQTLFPTLQFVRATGWAHGGHMRLEPMVFTFEKNELRVVRVELTNLDDNGYHRRLDDVLLCEVEWDQGLRASAGSMDLQQMDKWAAEKSKRCRSLWPAVKALKPSDAAALFLGALARESASVKGLQKKEDAPQLAELFASKTKGPSMGPVSWVGEPAPFVAWKDGHGMVVTEAPARLLQLDVTFGANFALEFRDLGFVREFIE